MTNLPLETGRRLPPIISSFFPYSRFGGQVVLVTLLFLACACVLLYQAFTQQYQQVVEIFQVVDENLQHELVVNDIVRRQVSWLVTSVVIYISAIVVLAFRARRRYEEPLVSIEKYVGLIGQGHYAHRIPTHAGHDMQELIFCLNELAEQLEQRHGPGTNFSDKKAGA